MKFNLYLPSKIRLVDDGLIVSKLPRVKLKQMIEIEAKVQIKTKKENQDKRKE